MPLRIPHWTEKELETLRSCHGKMSAALIGLRIGRSGAAVGEKLRRLGLTKGTRKRRPPPDPSWIDMSNPAREARLRPRPYDAELLR